MQIFVHAKYIMAVHSNSVTNLDHASLIRPVHIVIIV